MKGRVFLAWTLGAALAANWTLGVSRAQQPPPATPPYKVTPLLKAPLAGDPSKETVMVKVEWPANVSAVWHTHPGDEYVIVLEGSLISQAEGGEPKMVPAGQSFHNSPGVVHIAKTSDQPATTINVFIVERGKPLLEPAKK